MLEEEGATDDGTAQTEGASQMLEGSSHNLEAVKEHPNEEFSDEWTRQKKDR